MRARLEGSVEELCGVGKKDEEELPRQVGDVGFMHTWIWSMDHVSCSLPCSQV